MTRRPGAGRRAALLLGLLASSVALAGCGEASRELPPEWRGRDLTESGWADGLLRPGWGLGLEYVWPAGEEVEWDWFVNGTGVLHYQVVRVENGQAEALRAVYANESVSALTIIRSGAHQVVWRNEAFSDVRFWYKVPEGHGAPRLYSPTQGPDCAFLAVAHGQHGPARVC